jgi:Zn-dependent protease with chaperone function
VADHQRSKPRARALTLRVTCPCGAVTSVRAGSVAACGCGRHWETGSVPDADLAGVRSSLRGLRQRQALFVLGLALAVGMMFLLRSSTPKLVLVVVFTVLWLRLCLPWWRSRREATLAGAPTWALPPAPTDLPHQ